MCRNSTTGVKSQWNYKGVGGMAMVMHFEVEVRVEENLGTGRKASMAPVLTCNIPRRRQ